MARGIAKVFAKITKKIKGLLGPDENSDSGIPKSRNAKINVGINKG